MALPGHYNSPGCICQADQCIKDNKQNPEQESPGVNTAGNYPGCIQPVLFLWRYTCYCFSVNWRCTVSPGDVLLDRIPFHGSGDFLSQYRSHRLEIVSLAIGCHILYQLAIGLRHSFCSKKWIPGGYGSSHNPGFTDKKSLETSMDQAHQRKNSLDSKCFDTR